MNLLLKLTLQNFKCFRKSEKFDLSDSTYFVGINNSGKSAVLNAIRYFFDSSIYDDSNFLNRAEFLAKGAGSNKTIISLEINLNEVNTKTLKRKLIKQYGPSVTISKIITFSPRTGRIKHEYQIENNKPKEELADENLRKVIEGVKITYLHPQEGDELLANAQRKLRQRLLDNWGRSSGNITRSLKTLQKYWENLGEKANTYLSSSLTQNIQAMWPESEVLIELPKHIQDVLSISEIKFKSPGAPEIELTSQGTGAQSTILYLTHFLLDSDRSLHRGEYHPIWLLEEPESFLHADLMVKFSRELNSYQWLHNIQMLISTHSPLILANSRLGGTKVRWNLLKDKILEKSKLATKWTESEVINIGRMMGDSHFYSYFLASTKEKLVFIEDSKKITGEKYYEAGIRISKQLNGVSEVGKYIDFFSELSAMKILENPVFFIVDADKGKKELTRFIEDKKAVKEKDGFKKYKINNNVFLILLPEGQSAEDLFIEYENHLKECASKLWNIKTWEPKKIIGGNLSEVYSKIRHLKENPKNVQEAILIIKNHEDIKNIFWKKVKDEKMKMSESKIRTLLDLVR